MNISHTELYRSFLRHLRIIPDPHVWFILQPRIKLLLQQSNRVSSDNSANAATLRYQRAARARARAERELQKLQMAVSCHPHALTRLVEDVYGRRGPVRQNLINNIMSTSCVPGIPTARGDLPPPLIPHAPSPVPPALTAERARSTTPISASVKAARKARRREWGLVQVPLVLPSNLASQPSGRDYRTGWEEMGVVQSLRVLAGLESGEGTWPHAPLPTLRNLSPNMQFLHRSAGLHSRLPGTPYPPPPSRCVRQTPARWSSPRTLSPKLLRKIYLQLWNSLVWTCRSSTQPNEGGWISCSFEDYKYSVRETSNPAEPILPNDNDHNSGKRKWLRSRPKNSS